MSGKEHKIKPKIKDILATMRRNPSDPRINIQNNKGMTKTYQVKQVLKAIERMEVKENVGE